MADSTELLRQAAQFIKTGDKTAAQRIIVQVLKADPQNETAWYFVAGMAEDPTKRRQALEKVLAVNPFHEKAQAMLDALNQPMTMVVSHARPEPRQTVQPSRSGGGAVVFVVGLLFGALIVGGLVFGVMSRNVPAAVESTLNSAFAVFTQTAIAAAWTETPTNTPTATITPLPTETPTSTPTATITLTPVDTDTPAPTQKPTRTPEPPPDTGGWRETSTTSSLTDITTLTLQLDADDTFVNWLGTENRATLLLRCEGGKLDAYIAVGTQIESNSTTYAIARYRFDKGPAYQATMNLSTSGQALFFHDAATMIGIMLDHQKFTFGFTPYNSGDVEMTFDLRGLNNVIQPMHDLCRF